MTRFRIMPGRRCYRLEAVTAAGEIELVETFQSEDQAVAELRERQFAIARAAMHALRIEESPRGPGGVRLPVDLKECLFSMSPG